MSQKKILIIVIGILILSGVVAFFLVRDSRLQKNETSVGSLTELSSNNLDKSNFESTNLAQFSISFPKSFIASEQLLSGGEGVVLTLNSEELEKNKGSFIVEKYPVDKVGLPSLKEYFSDSKLSQKDIILGQNRIRATYFTGAIPSLQGVIQQNVILLSHNGYAYKIQMSYVSEERKELLDEEFRNVSSTIKFL